MGGLISSYFVENKVKTALCNAITTSNTSEIKRIMSTAKESSPGSSFVAPLNFIKQMCYYSKEADDGSGVDLLNAQIDQKGNTPLLLSIETGQLESFKFLLIQLNADPNICNYETGYSPLHMLAKVKCNANLNYKTSSRTNSQKSSSFSKAALIIPQSPVDLDKPFTSNIQRENETQSKTPSTISEEALREMVYLLVDKGAMLNETIQIDISSDWEHLSVIYFTPLMLAVYTLNFIVADELLNLGCDCNFQEKNSKISALHLACYMPNFEFVNLLLDDEIRFIKIKIDLMSANGNNCLHWLALSRSHDDIGIFKLFINYLMKRYTMSNTSSPISNASSTEFSNDFEKSIYTNGLENYLKKFLDQPNNLMQTSLMLASLNNKQHLVRQILDSNATIELKDKDGKNAYYYAKKSQSCSQLLQSFSKIKNSLTIRKSYYKPIYAQNSEDSFSNQIKEADSQFSKEISSIDDDNETEQTENNTKNSNILNITPVGNDLAKVI